MARKRRKLTPEDRRKIRLYGVVLDDGPWQAKMEKWDPEAGCPKCGTRHLMVTWCPAEDERQVDGRPGIYLSRPRPEDMRTEPAKPERLEVICRQCGYDWQAEPLNLSAASR